jgi:CubicO group peptidase (beta-lactamase class C family)
VFVAVLAISLLAADEKTDKVDKIFAQWDTTTSPGCALAVVKDGQIIYKRGYGMAKLEDDIVITPDKIFDLFAQERIFKPLGMTYTLYQDDHRQIIKNRATGYEQAEKGFRLNMSNWDETGDGNVYTSVEDLYLWDQAFYNNKLGRDLMDMLHTVGVLNNGVKLDYAFGLVIRDYEIGTVLFFRA